MRLDSLQTAINNSVQTVKEWELAHPNPNKAPFNALVEEHKICKSMLGNFWKVSEKYTQSLLNGKGSKMKRECAKIKWCMFRSDDAVVLERNLSMHVVAINMYCCELRWYVSLSIGRRQLFLLIHCRILKDIADSNSSALAVIGRNVDGNTFTLKDILLAMQRFDKLLRSIQRNIVKFSTQKSQYRIVSSRWPAQTIRCHWKGASRSLLPYWFFRCKHPFSCFLAFY
jgi:hypothetical protein